MLERMNYLGLWRARAMQNQNRDIYFIGAGLHAKVIRALPEALGRKCLCIYDDNEQRRGTTFLGVPVIGAVKEIPDICDISAVIAIGDNATRKHIAESFRNICWATLVHPHSWVHGSVKIDEGSVAFSGTVVQPDTRIGKHSIINTSSSVDHDCRIGDFCHIAPGCHLAGGVNVGDITFIGVGTAVIPSISIILNTTIGAGAAVVKDIRQNGTYVGVPAKVIFCEETSNA